MNEIDEAMVERLRRWMMGQGFTVRSPLGGTRPLYAVDIEDILSLLSATHAIVPKANFEALVRLAHKLDRFLYSSYPEAIHDDILEALRGLKEASPK